MKRRCIPGVTRSEVIGQFDFIPSQPTGVDPLVDHAVPVEHDRFLAALDRGHDDAMVVGRSSGNKLLADKRDEHRLVTVGFFVVPIPLPLEPGQFAMAGFVPIRRRSRPRCRRAPQRSIPAGSISSIRAPTHGFPPARTIALGELIHALQLPKPKRPFFGIDHADRGHRGQLFAQVPAQLAAP